MEIPRGPGGPGGRKGPGENEKGREGLEAEGDEKREFYKILSCMAEEMGKLTSCFKITELIFVSMLLSVSWKHIQLLSITVEVFSL